MQSVGGSNRKLVCADCKTSSTSASLLLKHFAEHIIEQAFEAVPSVHNDASTLTPRKKAKLSLLQAKKKGRKESILEAALRQSAIQSRMSDKACFSGVQNDITCNSNTTSSSDSFKSASSHNCSSSNSVITKCIKTERVAFPNDMVVEIKQRAREKHKLSTDATLIKCDLQKRLENCVSRIASRQGGSNEVQIAKNSSLFCSPMKVSRKNDTMLSASRNISKKKDSQEFSPLTYCVVTLEETVGKGELSGKTLENTTRDQHALRPQKGTSSRKQLMPKKIHRPPEDAACSDTSTSATPPLPDGKMCQKPLAKRKYTCHVCSKAFGWSTDLKRHTLTHTGERPFKCQLCDATFTRNFLLQKHESRVHSVDSSEARLTQDDGRDLGRHTENNNEEEGNVLQKQVAGRQGKTHQGKSWKGNGLFSDNVKNSLNLKLEEIEESCDKFVPAKRKLQCDDPSFDHFPQKVFNIL